MMAWANISLSFVASNGNLTQLYPECCTAGSGAATLGTLIRAPLEGTMVSLQVEPDGTNGGEIEIWDINGADCGADVDTGTTITNAQLVAAKAAGLAKIMYSQKFQGTAGARLTIAGGTPFSKGLAARFIGAAGTCQINAVVDGGFVKRQYIG